MIRQEVVRFSVLLFCQLVVQSSVPVYHMGNRVHECPHESHQKLRYPSFCSEKVRA